MVVWFGEEVITAVGVLLLLVFFFIISFTYWYVKRRNEIKYG